MSLSIFDRGEGRFDLVYGDTEIGWVSDRAIGFNGYALRAQRDGAVDRLMVGEVSVGRLFSGGIDDGYAFELDLPPRLGATLSAAQVMYYALERSGATRPVGGPIEAA
jgi:hypothetical protein